MQYLVRKNLLRERRKSPSRILQSFNLQAALNFRLLYKLSEVELEQANSQLAKRGVRIS